MFLPDSIDLAQSEKYSLSIRLTPSGFSFLIFSASDKNIHYHNETVFNENLPISENIKKIFFESNIFRHPFSKIKVSVVSDRYTLLPSEFFDKKDIADIFRFNFHGGIGKVLENHLPTENLNVLFDLDEDTYSFLYRNLWNPFFSSFISDLLPFCTNYGEKENNRCFVFFHDNMATIIFYRDKSLLSANTFQSDDEANFIYNIVNIWDKHSFNQNEDYLYIDADEEKSWVSISTLKQLIKNVETITLPKEVLL